VNKSDGFGDVASVIA